MVTQNFVFISILMASTLLSGCNCPTPASPQSASKAEIPQQIEPVCSQKGVPEVRALYTAEGVLLWELGMPFPRKNVFYDAIEIHGENLCAGKLSLGDGYTLARDLPYSLLPKGNIRVKIPWGLERITQSVLFRTDHSFTRVDLHVVPVDKLTRQIFIRGLKSEKF